MTGQYAPPQSPVAPIAERLRRSGAFDVEEHSGRAVALRRRRLPGRGILRLLIPRVVVRVRPTGAGASCTIRPDSLAWVMLVIMIGGVVVEATMDRVRYPREYPPAFVFAIAGIYITLLIAEVVASVGAVRRAGA